MYQDVWAALNLPVNGMGELGDLRGNVTRGGQDLFAPRDGVLCLGKADCVAAQSEVMKFVGPGTKAVPMWLAVTYLSSNVVLNSLNFYWFGKMIETVRKRFEKKPAEEPDRSGNEKPEDEKPRGSLRRRKTSIVLEVADGLERDESFGAMLDGTAEPGLQQRSDGEHPHTHIQIKSHSQSKSQSQPQSQTETSNNAQSSALDHTRTSTPKRR